VKHWLGAQERLLRGVYKCDFVFGRWEIYAEILWEKIKGIGNL